MQNIQSIQKEILKNSLNENETKSTDIENYDIMIGKIINDTLTSGLIAKVSYLIPLSTPSGLLFYEKVTNDSFKIEKKQIDVDSIRSEVEISLETIDDLLSLSDSTERITNWIQKSYLNKMDIKFSEFLNANASEVPDLELDKDSDMNTETRNYCVLQKINECITKMNKDNQKSLKAFCILPFSQSAQALSFSKIYSDIKTDEQIEAGFLGVYGSVKFYMNSNSNDDNVYVGMLSNKFGSIIYSPYNIILKKIVDVNSGNYKYISIVRYGLNLNPQSTKENPFLVKFKIKRV